MSEQQEQDRSEKATPFKLQEAKNRGQVAKSLEVNSFLILATLLGILYFLGDHFIYQQLRLSHALLVDSHELIFDASALNLLVSTVFGFLADTYWLLMMALIVVSILATIVQTGPVFSFFPLKPDVQRLNPVQGFKRLFSMKLVYESIKTVIKLILYGFIIYLVIKSVIPITLAMIDVDPQGYPLFILDNMRRLMFKLLIAIFLVALIDVAYTRYDFSKRMRMSRREVKEEVKRREGDPLIRAKLRELQREAAKRAGSINRVPEADVLITNPTHFSVAIKYDRETMLAPEVLAKGAGDLALQMREVATKKNVPVVENKVLARKLFRTVDINGSITEDLYPAVAEILVWAYVRKKNENSKTYRQTVENTKMES